MVVIEVVMVLPSRSHTLMTDVARLSILRRTLMSTSSKSSITTQTLSPTHTTTTHEVGQRSSTGLHRRRKLVSYAQLPLGVGGGRTARTLPPVTVRFDRPSVPFQPPAAWRRADSVG